MNNIPFHPTSWKLCLPVLLLALCAGCAGGGAPPKPVEVAEGDACVYCKKPIADKRFACEFVTGDGFVRKFDDIGCMILHAKKAKKGAISAFFTVDYDKKEWSKAEQMTYLRSKNLKTPAGGGLAAFSDKARAQALAAQFQGEAVGFDELMK